MVNVYDILRKRYPANEYALMEEVRDKAGFDASRSADFVLMNLWPSRGLHLTGFEQKSNRNDWLKELKQPDKAENVFQFCDFWWLLTMEDNGTPVPSDIAKLEEIPATWGWMAIRKGKIEIRKEAPKLEPRAMSRHFLAAMLKRACDKTNYVHLNSIQDKIKAAKESGAEDRRRSVERLEKELAEIKKTVQEFYKASGIDLNGFYRWQTNPAKMGQAVKFIEQGGVEHVKKDLLMLKSRAQEVLNSITNNLHTFDELDKPA